MTRHDMDKLVLGALCFLIAIALLPFCSAALLHGTVYDADLNKVDDAIVEINSVPSQRIVSQNGTYSFQLNPGDYVLNAYEKQGNYTISSALENISIKQEGSYVFDLFLFPSLDEDVLIDANDINVGDVSLAPESGVSNYFYYAFAAIILIGIAAIIVFVLLQMQNIKAGKENKPEQEPAIHAIQEKSKEEKPESRSSGSDLDLIIGLIRKDGGRTTQKELRKQLPHSEAKISLMLTELEHKGKIERIKKGRGNIIVLK
jgi:uncharacterized membrane protein